MDGRLSQFAAHLSSQGTENVEMVVQLEEGMTRLLQCYREKNNGKMPLTIIVYRDGVADSQFQQVLDIELPGMRNALGKVVLSVIAVFHVNE